MFPVVQCKATLNQQLNSVIKSGFQQVNSTILWQHNYEEREYSVINKLINGDQTTLDYKDSNYTGKNWYCSAIIVLLARPTSTKREESGEPHIQAASHRTIQCGPITLQRLVT